MKWSRRDIRLTEEIDVPGEAQPAPAWQVGSWYETLNGQPSRAEWEDLMGHPVAFAPEPEKGQFTMDNSFIMKIQYKVTEKIIAKQCGTKLLKDGENELTVQLADGWYRGSCGAWGLKNQYGTETKLLVQLEITRLDGTMQTIATDECWDWSNDGPICFADNKDGEIADASWVPTYSQKAKKTRHNVVPTASNNVPVTEHERFQPTMTIAPNGKRLFDFGQNIAGWLEFRVQAKKGQRIRIRCGELLDESGNLTLKNIQCARKDFNMEAIRYAD